MTSVHEVDRIKILRRRFKFVCYGFVIVGLIYFFTRYDFVTLPTDYEYLAPMGIHGGTIVVLTDCDEDTVIGKGTIVVYKPPGHEDKVWYGVVAAIPGEELVVEKLGAKKMAIVIDGARRIVAAHDGVILETGTIPSDAYLLLNGDTDLMAKGQFWDSRDFGPVSRSRFTAKIVVPLNFLR